MEKQNKHKILKGKPEWLEKDLFKATMFAKQLIKNGTPPGLANYKAGQYYGYSASDVGWARNQLKQAKSIIGNKQIKPINKGVFFYSHSVVMPKTNKYGLLIEKIRSKPMKGIDIKKILPLEICKSINDNLEYNLINEQGNFSLIQNINLQKWKSKQQ